RNRRRGDRLCGRLRHLVRAHDWPPTSHAGISADQIMNVLELSTPALVLSHEEAERLSDADALHLVFHPGLSTAEQITEISGRGMGMDIVKSVIERLKGSVTIDSK